MLIPSSIHRLAAVVFAACCCAPATAQFPGDVFFAEPSVTVPEGEVAELRLQCFAGAQAFGAADVDIEFDPALATIEGFAGPDADAVRDNFAVRTEPGRYRIVVFNPTSRTTPIGTTDLGTIRLRPTAAAGTGIPIRIRVRSTLDGDTNAFRSANGFGGLITVTSNGAGSLASHPGPRTAIAWDDLELVWRRLAAGMGLDGGTVTLWLPTWTGFGFGAAPVEIRIPPRTVGDGGR